MSIDFVDAGNCQNIGHNSALTAMADRVIRVRSGQITDVRQNEAPMPVESIEW